MVISSAVLPAISMYSILNVKLASTSKTRSASHTYGEISCQLLILSDISKPIWLPSISLAATAILSSSARKFLSSIVIVAILSASK